MAADKHSGGNSDTEQLQTLLAVLGLLPDPTKTEPDGKTGQVPPEGALDPGDPQFQVLKSGVTKLSKFISGLIAGAGGIGAAWAAIQAYFASSSPGLQIALVASAAGIVGLATVSVALIVSADLRARAAGASAQYQARGQVAAAYESLHGTSTSPRGGTTTAPVTVLSSDLTISLLAVAAGGRQVQARPKDGEMLHLTGIRYEDEKLEVRLSARATPSSSSDKWHSLAAIDQFETTH